MKTSWPPHLKGHSSGYSKAPSALKSIVRVTFEVKVKSTKKLQLCTPFQKYAPYERRQVKTSRPNHLKGHSSGYSKTLIQHQSIGRVTFEVKVKSTKNHNYIPSFKNMLYKNDVMWKQADLSISKDTLQAIQKHHLRSNPLVGWPSRSRSKVQKSAIMYSSSKICSIRTTSCENKPT